MTTVILVGLIVVLAVAAAYVGLLLVRRSRPRPDESDPAAPWTVGDLVRMRNGRPLSGSDLFTPAAGLPVTDPALGSSESGARGVVGERDVADAPDAADDGVAARGSSAPRTRTDGQVPGVDVGDAPWRRAARMTGSEPGGAWETAPTPVVPPAVPAAPPAPRVADPDPVEPEAPRLAGASRRDAAAAAPVVAAAAPAEPAPEPAAPIPADLPAETVAGLEPVVPRASEPELAPEPEPDAVESVPGAVESVPGAVEPDAAPVAVSRPLSDPDLTPLMGIPLVRPAAAADPVLDDPALDDPVAEDPVAEDPVAEDYSDLDDTPDADDDTFADAPTGSSRRTDPVPSPRSAPPRASEDEVVSLLSAYVTAPAAAVTGSPQPVVLRVVRRDAEPVADAVVTLLDDRGQQVDATKTAADGGGELRTPHGGRFLLIAGRDGFQPRAVTLAVDDAPVEVALLLPGSATLAGLVRDAGRPVAGARVVARQEGEVVDEIVTGPDGSYRFDDLAEGTYAVTATEPRGTAVLRVAVQESADLHHDLDLVPPGGAP